VHLLVEFEVVEVVGHQNSVLHVVNRQETSIQNIALHLAASLPNLNAFGCLFIPAVVALLFVRHQLPRNSQLVGISLEYVISPSVKLLIDNY